MHLPYNMDYIPITHSPRAPSGGVRFGGVGAAPASVPRKHGSGRPRVTVRPHYGGPPSRAGRGRMNAGESRGIRRVKSPPPSPGSTVPRPKIAAVERREATRPCAPGARRKASNCRWLRLSALRPLGLRPGAFRPLREPAKARPAPLNIPGRARACLRGPARAVSEMPQAANRVGRDAVDNLTLTLAGAERTVTATNQWGVSMQQGVPMRPTTLLFCLALAGCAGANASDVTGSIAPAASPSCIRRCRAAPQARPPARRKNGGRRAASPARRSTPCAG